MQELIKVTEENGEQLVSAKELHEFLEVKSKFADWFKNRVSKYGFEENQDYVSISKNLENGGREIDYVLKLDIAKELSMVEGNEKGSQARKYFIQCEKKLKQVTKKQLPENYLEALKQLVISEEKRIEAEKTNAILMHVNKNYTSTEIAKELNLKSATELNKKLKELNVQYKQNDTWVLYSKYSNLGYVDIKQNVLDSGKVVYDRKWTQLGRKFLLELFCKDVI